MSDFIAEIYVTDKFGYHLFHHITVEGSQLKQQTLSNHLWGAETWSRDTAAQLYKLKLGGGILSLQLWLQ